MEHLTAHGGSLGSIMVSRAEPSRAEPSRAEPSRAEPSRAEPSRECVPAPPDKVGIPM